MFFLNKTGKGRSLDNSSVIHEPAYLRDVKGEVNMMKQSLAQHLLLAVIVCVVLPISVLHADAHHSDRQDLALNALATPDYDLAIRLIPDAHRMEVSGTLFLPSEDKPQTSINLVLSDLMKDFRVEVL